MQTTTLIINIEHHDRDPEKIDEWRQLLADGAVSGIRLKAPIGSLVYHEDEDTPAIDAMQFDHDRALRAIDEALHSLMADAGAPASAFDDLLWMLGCLSHICTEACERRPHHAFDRRYLHDLDQALDDIDQHAAPLVQSKDPLGMDIARIVRQTRDRREAYSRMMNPDAQIAAPTG